MVGLWKRLARIGLVGVMLLSGLALEADAARQSPKMTRRARSLPRLAVFGNAAGNVWPGSAFSAVFAGGGFAMELPVIPHLVLGSYLAGNYVGPGEFGFGILEGGGVLKMRLPLNTRTAWVFPFRGGIGGGFSGSGSIFLGTFHGSLIGVETLLSRRFGLAFGMPLSVIATGGSPLLFFGAELGFLLPW